MRTRLRMGVLALGILVLPTAIFAREIRVSTPDELIEAIAPETTIVVSAGTHNLTEASGLTTEFVSWQDFGDGQAPVITGVYDLTIRGETGTGEQGTELLGQPRYTDVITFRACESVSIEHLAIGHTAAAEGCMGGVLRFVNCTDMVVRRSELFGSGTFGIISEFSFDIRLEASTINACTVGAISSWRTTGLSVTDSSFISNHGYELFGLYDTYDISFTDCLVFDNTADVMFSLGADPGAVTIAGGEISENRIARFSDIPNQIDVDDTTVFANNDFEPPDSSGSPAIPDDGVEVIHVRGVVELLDAIGSNREIIVLPGRYNLTDAAGGAFPSIQWGNVFDGLQPIIHGVENLTMRSDGEPAEIVIEPRYAFVLAFSESNNITLDNLSISHTEAGFCAGGVVYAEESTGVSIERCVLEGSGTWGVEFSDVEGALVSESLVTNCTSGIALIRDSADITFHNNLFANNAEWDMFDLFNARGVAIEECEFTTNTGSAMFRIGGGSSQIIVRNSAFYHNRVDSFSTSKLISLIDNVYGNNDFTTPDWERTSETLDGG